MLKSLNYFTEHENYDSSTQPVGDNLTLKALHYIYCFSQLSSKQ